MRDTFDLLGTPAEYHIPFSIHKLSNVTHTWWETIGYNYDTFIMTWEVFERLFADNYFNVDHRHALAYEFERLEKGSMIVIDYYNYFIELAQYSWVGTVDIPSLISKIWTYLRSHIFENMIALWFSSLVECYTTALQFETSLDMRSARRAWARSHSDSDSCKISYRDENMDGRDRDRDNKVVVARRAMVPGDMAI